MFYTNHDWDPQNLRELVCQDFYDFKEYWQSSVADTEFVTKDEKTMATERYSLLVEDISLDDDTLYEAVTQIERVCIGYLFPMSLFAI